MSVKFPTLDEITQKLVDELAGAGKKIDDLPNAWLIKALIIGTRSITYDQVLAAKAGYEASSILTAIDDDLDKRCEERSATVRRKQAVNAAITFKLSKSTAATSDVTIPAGSLITVQAIGTSPALDFTTLTAATLATGQTFVQVDAKCTTAGIVGNLATSTPVYPAMVGIDSASVVSTVTSGSDKEDDTTLRNRLLTEVQNLEKGGTEIDYEIWAKRVTGVVTAKSIPLAQGNGTIDVTITGSAGLPTAQLITDVQTYLDSKKPAGGVSVLVKAPTAVTVNVTASIKVASGYLFTNVEPLVEKAINDTINTENSVGIVRLAKLRNSIGDVEGVFNYTMTVPSADTTIASGQLAVPGTHTITEIV